MRRIVFFVNLCVGLWAGNLFSQPLLFSGEMAHNTTKDSAFNQLKKWVLTESELTQSTPEEGIIIGKGSMYYNPIGSSFDGDVNFSIRIEIKEETVKYYFTNFEHECKDFDGICISFGKILSVANSNYSYPLASKRKKIKTYQKLINWIGVIFDEMSNSIKSNLS